MSPEVSFNAQEQYEYDWDRWLCCIRVWRWGPSRGVLATTRFHHDEFGGQIEMGSIWAKWGLTGLLEKGQFKVIMMLVFVKFRRM
jgi:hypothetical protein